jgi:hypothetical protein
MVTLKANWQPGGQFDEGEEETMTVERPDLGGEEDEEEEVTIFPFLFPIFFNHIEIQGNFLFISTKCQEVDYGEEGEEDDAYDTMKIEEIEEVEEVSSAPLSPSLSPQQSPPLSPLPLGD